MVNLLRKCFIKDYQNVNNPKVRDKHGYLATVVGIISNLILVIIKLATGFVSGSIAIIGDGLNNLSDMGSSIITMLGFKVASMPPDKKHPYGHERVEYISGLIVSIIILTLSLQILVEAITSLVNNTQIEINSIALIILGISIFIKLWQGYFYYQMGKKIDSLALKANARDSLNDALSTGVILIGSIVIYFVPAIPFALDGLLGIFVAIFIFISGLEMIKETASPLIGMNPNHEYIRKIIDKILSYPNVLGVHDVRCHMYGPTKSFMTVHVEIPANINFLTAHDEVDNIERDIREGFGIDLTIHMDPVEIDNPLVNQLKSIVSDIIKDMDLSFHDFRVVEGNTHTNVLFDVVIPAKSIFTEENVLKRIERAFEDLPNKYYLIVNFDNEYIENI